MSYSFENRPFRAETRGNSVRLADNGAIGRLPGLVLIALAALVGCQSAAYVRPQPPSLEEIVAQKKAGVPDEALVSRIAASEGRYYLRSEAVEYLLQNGVGRPLVDYLLGTAWSPSRVYVCDTCHESWFWHSGFWAHHHHHWGW